MFSFADLIRYGFPGYLLTAAALVSTWTQDVFPFGTRAAPNDVAITVATVVVGPFVGYLIHQLYFLLFDSFESYDKTRRACVRAIAQLADTEVTGARELSAKQRERLAYAAWKFVMTNMGDQARVSDVFLRRLTSLHGFQHSFGSILVACALSAIILIPTIGNYNAYYWIPYVAYGTLLAMTLMFAVKRRGVAGRADIFERVAVIRLRNDFKSFMQSVIVGNRSLNIIPEWDVIDDAGDLHGSAKAASGSGGQSGRRVSGKGERDDA